MTHQEERRADARPGIGRSATAALFTVLVVGAVLQALHLAHEWRSNPFARDPLNDARVYWDWAGDLAAGRYTVCVWAFWGATPVGPYVLSVTTGAP